MIDPTAYDSYKLLTMGKDSALIATLDPEDWTLFVNAMINEAGGSEWYNTTLMQHIYNATGVGYYPNGITLDYATSNGAPGNTIIIVSTEKKNLLLLAHEYGHVLGYEHTSPTEIEVMNPVAQMRHRDKHGLSNKFIENFPEYYERFILPTQQTVDKAVTYGLLGAVAWGLLK